MNQSANLLLDQSLAFETSSNERHLRIQPRHQKSKSSRYLWYIGRFYTFSTSFKKNFHLPHHFHCHFISPCFSICRFHCYLLGNQRSNLPMDRCPRYFCCCLSYINRYSWNCFHCNLFDSNYSFDCFCCGIFQKQISKNSSLLSSLLQPLFSQ
jgi:hypothetical protein